MSHTPVLLEAVTTKVREIPVRDGVFLDGTFGRGGHTRAVLRTRPDFKVIGLDCDEEAIVYGQREFASHIASGHLTLSRENFSDFKENGLSGVLLDLGVSSPQLDEGRRGFSFYHSGPLDMRMDDRQTATAADIVNTWGEQKLNDLFHDLGEVRSPFRVTKKILEARKEKLFRTTDQLSQLIERAEGWHKKGHHPATNYFLALRIEVNQELARLQKAIPALAQALVPGGRLLVITFHSLEDRIVKMAMKALVQADVGELTNKKVIQPTWPEKKENPRARSAKLRVFQRGQKEKS